MVVKMEKENQNWDEFFEKYKKI
jgi:hypothetical protein